MVNPDSWDQIYKIYVFYYVAKQGILWYISESFKNEKLKRCIQGGECGRFWCIFAIKSCTEVILCAARILWMYLFTNWLRSILAAPQQVKYVQGLAPPFRIRILSHALPVNHIVAKVMCPTLILSCLRKFGCWWMLPTVGDGGVFWRKVFAPSW